MNIKNAKPQHLEIVKPVRTYCCFRRYYGTTITAADADIRTARKKLAESLASIGRNRRIAKMLQVQPSQMMRNHYRSTVPNWKGH